MKKDVNELVKEQVKQYPTLSRLVEETQDQKLQITMRDIHPPAIAPYLHERTELVDFMKELEPKGIADQNVFGRQEVTVQTVIRAIRKDIGDTGGHLHISDNNYLGYTIWDTQRFLTNHDYTNQMLYINEVFDCDNFAQVCQGNVNRVLVGIPFGTIWYYNKERTWGHSANIGYCYKQDRIYLLEPQSDKFYRFNKNEWRAGLIIM